MRDGRPTVLIVDDEIDMRLLIRVLLESAHLDVEVVGEAASGEDALAALLAMDPPHVPDVVVLDNRMPGRSGIDVAEEMIDQVPRQHIVLFSAFVTPELEAIAADLGIRACVSKTDFDRLPDLIAELARPTGE